MRARAERVHVEFIHVQRQLPCGLYGVGVKGRAQFTAQSADLRDRLHRADLIVGIHHTDDRNVLTLAEQLRHLVYAHTALAVDGRQRQLEPVVVAQVARRVEYCLMLNRRRNDPVGAALLPPRYSDAAQGRVVALRTATGEDDLPGLCANHAGDLAPRLL